MFFLGRGRGARAVAFGWVYRVYITLTNWLISVYATNILISNDKMRFSINGHFFSLSVQAITHHANNIVLLLLFIKKPRNIKHVTSFAADVYTNKYKSFYEPDPLVASVTVK